MGYIEVLIILCCAAASSSGQASCSLCVTTANTNESRTECQLFNITGPNIRPLSDIGQKYLGCKTVQLFFTSGTHTLNKSIDFPDAKKKNISMIGAAKGDPSVIDCIKNYGIKFSQQKRPYSNKVFISISDLRFTHCKREMRTMGYSRSPVALYFKYVSYTLRNVAVVNTSGYGLFADGCNQQVIVSCRFVNSTAGHIHITFRDYERTTDVFVSISKTTLYAGRSTNGSGGVSIRISDKKVSCVITIAHCTFNANEGSNGSHMLVTGENNPVIKVENSTFSNSLGADTYGVRLSSESLVSTIDAAILNCSFFKNGNGAVEIIHARHVEIMNCTITNNRGTGVVIKTDRTNPARDTSNTIVNTSFSGNLGGIYCYAELNVHHRHRTEISHCKFTNHILRPPSKTITIPHSKEAVVQSEKIGLFRKHSFIIENTVFERNRGNNDSNCSCLSVRNSTEYLVLNGVTFTNNKCTGISLIASNMTIQNKLEMKRNFGMLGGAIRMLSVRDEHSKQFSSLFLRRESSLIMTNNYARFYGGGLYTDVTCEYRHPREDCPFQFEGGTPSTAAIRFSGNLAELGGDASYGGCLSNCFVYTHSNESEFIDINDPRDNIYSIISLEDSQSSSTFAEFPKRVAFCSNTTTPARNSTHCKNEQTVNAYRGEMFELPLMIEDEFCVPSVEYVEAKIVQSEISAHLGDMNSYRKLKKYCSTYFYLLKADLNVTSVKIELFIHQETLSKYSPAILTVHLDDCPAGFEFDGGKWECVCSNFLKHRGIKCDIGTHTLEIPAFTWLGEIQGREAVHKYCQYCNPEGEVTIRSLNDSDRLCTHNRTGILCGECITGYSLKLGGYKCADCSQSTYRVALLLVGFAVTGLATVLLLLGLNLTVSTGTINGIIFYSNIVYLNRDVLLPLNQDTGRTYLDDAIMLLFTFQAWMNLDFGIKVCFFGGYNIYIGTWLQFVFPLYIWLLIQIIIVASRYSRRISKVTASNTVSVLATLMLLSYAKLLTTIIEAGSYTDAEFLNDSSKHRVWILDGNIQYQQGKHLPLFLISLVMAAIYILPFTMLILLGPLLQAKSHWRLLNWVNKLKPFLDAFYGPYTSWYRYWPGILLLARLVIFGTVAYYSLGDGHFKLVTISVAVAMLLLVWLVIGIQTHRVSLYQKRGLNYLELFFHMNLLIFAIFSIYHTQITERTRNQQLLASVMVGSVLFVFCGIVVYQMICGLLRFSVMREVSQVICAKLSMGRGNAENDNAAQISPQEEEVHRDVTMTHSSIEMKECTPSTDELREPLLKN